MDEASSLLLKDEVYVVVGAAIEVHQEKGLGLIESIYERCMLRELELRSIPATTQKLVRVEYKGLVFDEPLRFDLGYSDRLTDQFP